MSQPFYTDGQTSIFFEGIQPFSELKKENFKKHPYQCTALVSYFLASAELELGRAPKQIEGDRLERDCVGLSAHGLFFAMMASLRVLEACTGEMPTLQTVYAAERNPSIRLQAQANEEAIRRFVGAKASFVELDTMARAAGFSVLTEHTDSSVAVIMALKRFKNEEFSVYQPLSTPMGDVLRSAIDWADN